jgi:ElaA protein
MEWHVKSFQGLSSEELYEILRLRSEVFVIEQHCIYQDMDRLDKQAFHLLGWHEGCLAAYARLLPPGLSYPDASIGRVVVAPAFRSMNFGRALMKEAVSQCEKMFDTRSITISAQLYLLKFYRELGFAEIGDSYPEDDIPHIKMIWSAV